MTSPPLVVRVPSQGRAPTSTLERLRPSHGGGARRRGEGR